jgi:O-antigen/teichoic acid export membrane protein
MTQSSSERVCSVGPMERVIERYAPALSLAITARARSARRRLWHQFLRLVHSRVAQSVAWSVIGSAFAQGGSFLSSLVSARILGNEAFGQYALIQSTVTTLTCLASMGLGLAATKYISEFRASQPERVGKVLGLSSILVILTGLCFSLSLAVAAPALAIRADRTDITTGFRLSAISIFFLTLTGYQMGALAGFEAFRSIGQIGIICGLASPLLSWWGAVRFAMRGAIVSQCAGALLLWSFYQIAVRKECRKAGITVRYRGVWEERSVLTRVSLPAAICGMVANLAIWGSNAILVKARGYGEFALFTVAFNLRSVVMFLPALIFRVATPRLNHLLAMGDLFRYGRAFWATVGVNGGMAFFIASVTLLGAQRFLRLFGKEFHGSSWLLALILISSAIEVTSNNLSIALITSCRFWRNLAIVGLWGVALLCGAVLAATRLGAAGLAGAYLAAWLLAAMVLAAEARGQSRVSNL